MVALRAGQLLFEASEGPEPPDQLRSWTDSLLNATAGKLGGGGAVEGDEPEQVDPELAQAEVCIWTLGTL